MKKAVIAVLLVVVMAIGASAVSAVELQIKPTGIVTDPGGGGRP